MILKWVKFGFPIPLVNEVIQTQIPKNNLSLSDQLIMATAIQNLLSLGAISECQQDPEQFISKIFLTPKSNGGFRFILNLKPFNKFVQKLHFKMEDYRTASKLIPKGGFLATIDLKESYLSLSILPSHRKYLRFQFENITYEFNAMPYGLSAAPRTFTKLMKEVISHLRLQGFSSVIYLDDILCIGKTYKECLSNVTETLRLLECLGFVINYDKSCLEPQQRCKFLGFIYDAAKLSLSLPDDKRINIVRLTNQFSLLPKRPLRDYAHLIGVLVAACPAVRYGWLYTKQLEREKLLALQNFYSYDTKIKFSNKVLHDLNWWMNKVKVASCPMGPLEFDIEIFTDASRTGWGAYANEIRASGQWKTHEKCFHINYLELLAAFFGLKCFAYDKSNCTILLRIDNVTAISYINRMGGVRFPHLNNLARTIWQWCEERKIWLYASYINTKDNIEADQESRRINPDTEIELNRSAFQIISQKLGQPDIDLFASRTNAKCDLYVSWKRDPEAFTVDAFTLNWNPWFFYSFPPFSIILKCLNKIINDKAEGILVYPLWPSQPWYPLLQSLIVSDVLYLDPIKDVVISSPRSRQRMNQLILAAATLSGSRSQGEVHPSNR